ncbi:hypothetical protein Pelo_13493 [Pelomyxa schiedti]|nr:hypothetical protein Pelo_13493 [Pelomyxa schiedti]
MAAVHEDEDSEGGGEEGVLTPEGLADDYSDVMDDSFAVLKRDILGDYEPLPGDEHPPSLDDPAEARADDGEGEGEGEAEGKEGEGDAEGEGEGKEGEEGGDEEGDEGDGDGEEGDDGESAAAPVTTQWEEFSNKGGVCVKKGWKSDNEVAPIFKAVGIIPNCTPEDVLHKVILNPDDAAVKVWNPTHGGNVVICETDRDDLRHVRLFINKQDGGVGGLVSPRDFGQLSAWEKDSNGRIWYFSTSVDDDSVNEPLPGYTRGTLWPSGFMLEPVPNANATRVHYTMHADLAGSLPRFIIDLAIPPQMCNFFEGAALVVSKKS